MRTARHRLPCTRTLRFALILGLLLSLLLTRGASTSLLSAAADGLLVRSVNATDNKILANGGQTTITIHVSGAADADEVTLTATLGAFGAPIGPRRIVLTLRPSAGGDGTASAELFGDGRAGTGVITGQVDDSTRSTAVIMVGRPASLEFQSPDPNEVVSAAGSILVTIQVRDSGGVTVPDTSIELSTNTGEVASGTHVGASISLQSDNNGRVSAALRSDPGIVRLSAATGDLTATQTITLHGAPVSLQVIAIRESMSPGSAPPGTFVVVLLDDGGRPVPNASVSFNADREGVFISHNADGESARTDGGGRATGHVVTPPAAEPGLVAITVEAVGLSDVQMIRILGSAESLALTIEAMGVGQYLVSAQVLDSAGFGIPEGPVVHWSPVGLESDQELVSFDPRLSPVTDGVATTVVTIAREPADELGVRARVALEGEVFPALAAPDNSIAIPDAAGFDGSSLAAGLNTVRWVGETAPIATILESIGGRVLAAWIFDPNSGWLGYFPSVAIGTNYTLLSGGLVSLFLIAPADLDGIEPLFLP